MNVTAPVNQPPVISDISPNPLDMLVGNGAFATYTASDPEGDTLTPSVVVDNPAVATADASVLGQVTVTALAEGTTNVTVTLTDAVGNTVSAAFTVNVTAPVNQPPVISAISPNPLDMLVGNGAFATYTASDPEGDTLTPSVVVDNPAVATADASVLGQVTVNALAEGTTNVTVTLTDAVGNTASAAFVVNVTAPVNQPPVISAISPNPLDMLVGNGAFATYTASDPEADTLTPSVIVDNPAVATADASILSQVTVTALAEGSTNVTVTITDAAGNTASAAFTVNVTAPVNQPPTISAIAPNPLALTVGDVSAATYSVSDPEGDVLTPSVIVDNPAVASADASVLGQVTVNALAEGSTNVTVTITDAVGNTASAAFTVNVSAAVVAKPPLLPGLPDLSVLNLAPYNINGNPSAFVLVGDDTLGTDNLLNPIATGSYTLGNYSAISGVTSSFNFNVQSLATGAGWTPQTVLDPAAADPGLCPGETPLGCELRIQDPVIVFITFNSSNATSIDVATFSTALQQIVNEVTASGALPVISTLVNDGIVTDQAVLDQYNAAIASIANANPAAPIPVWNAQATMDGAPQGVYNTSSGGAGDFTDAGLQFGANRRALSALQILDSYLSN